MKLTIQKWKSKHTWMLGVTIVALIFIGSLVIASPTYAWSWKDLFDWGLNEDETKEAINFLHNDWLEYSTVLGAIGHSIVGFIVKVLLILVGMLENLIPETFSLFDVLNDAGLNQFSQSMIKGLFVGIFTLLITWLGIRTMVMHKPPKIKSVVINIIMMVVLVGGLNEIMAQMQKVSVDFYHASTEGHKYDDGLAWKLVKENTADLVYLSQTSFDPIKGEKAEDTLKKEKNALSKDLFLRASLGDLVTPDVVKRFEKIKDVPKETKYLQYRLTNDGTKETLEKIDDSSFNILKKVTDTGYKRYPMNSLTIICALLSIGIAYAFTVFVFVITIFELVMKQVVAPLVFMTDIESGQKTKMVVMDICKGFLLIAFTGISIRIYTILVTYVGNADISVVLYIVAMIALTTMLIKGSESILRYFGVDVGLKDGKNHLLGAWAAMKGAQALGKGAMNLGGYVKDKLQGEKQSREDTPKRSEGNGTASDEAAASTPSRGGIARRLGTAAGYAANRGAKGMMSDAGHKVIDSANDVYETGKSKVSGVANQVKGTVSDFKEGQNQGRQTAQQNADRDTLNQIGRDVEKNATQGNDKAPNIQQANPHTTRMGDTGTNGPEGTGNSQDIRKDINLQKQVREKELDMKQGSENRANHVEQIQKEMVLQEKLNPNNKISVPSAEHKGGTDQILKDITMQEQLRGNGTVSPGTDSPSRGRSETVQRDVEVKNNVKGNGTVDSPVRGTSQAVQRDIEVKNNVKGNGTVDSPVRGTSQTVQRDVEVKNNVKGNGTVDSPVRGTSQTVQRDVEVKNNVKGNDTVDSPARGTSQTVQRDVEVKNNVKGEGTVDSPVRGTSQTVQRDVEVKNNVKEREMTQRHGVPTFKQRGSTKSRFDQLDD